jgi:dTDP-4-amino-4,6-dideoxygalactose transaminase
MYNYNFNYIEIFSIVKNLLNCQIDDDQNVNLFKDKLCKKIKLDKNKTVITNNVADAFSILFKTLKINGDIIISSFASHSIANAIVNSNNKIVFSETEEDLNISLNSIKKVYHKNCKAIIVNNYAGVQPEDLYRIKGFCKEKNIILIEDRSANLIGGKNNHLADFVVYDFNYDKILNAIDGGMIYVNNNKYQKYLEELFLQTNQGIKNNNFSQIISSGQKSKIPIINAIIGDVKIDKLDDIIEKRLANEKIYYQELEHDFHVPKISQFPKSWYWVRTGKDKKIKILQRLIDNEIIIDFNYYPLHMNQIFNKENKKLLKVEELFDQIICLPIHENLKKDEIKRICKVLKK